MRARPRRPSAVPFRLPEVPPHAPGTAHRLRVVLWRARVPAAALAGALAVVAMAAAVRPPPPPDAPVVVAARALPRGAVVAAADVRVVRLPRDVVPDGAARAVVDVVGRVGAVALPAGLPVVPDLLLDASAAPPGTVVTAVPVADAAMAAYLVPGMRVDVLAPAAADGLVVPSAPSGGPAGDAAGGPTDRATGSTDAPDGATADALADAAAAQPAGVPSHAVVAGPDTGPGSGPGTAAAAATTAATTGTAGAGARLARAALVLPRPDAAGTRRTTDGGIVGGLTGGGVEDGTATGAAVVGGSVLLAVAPAEAEALVAEGATGPLTVLVVP